jgi:hypothetical protein
MMESQYDGECVLCHKEFKKGTQIHISKVNDSWVKCTDETCFKEQGGKVYEKKSGGKFGGKFVSQKFPITDAPKIYELAEGLLNCFLKHPDRQTESEDWLLRAEDQAIFIESMFRTLSQNFKPVEEQK